MARKLALDKLNEAIAGILNEYAGEIAGNVGEIAAQMGQKGAQALRQKSRETVDGSEYAKGWKYATRRTYRYTRTTIYNDHYTARRTCWRTRMTSAMERAALSVSTPEVSISSPLRTSWSIHTSGR